MLRVGRNDQGVARGKLEDLLPHRDPRRAGKLDHNLLAVVQVRRPRRARLLPLPDDAHLARAAARRRKAARKKPSVPLMADPEDARATLVAFTDEGWRFLEDAHHVKREIETGYAAVLGEERMGLLRSALEELLEHEEEKAGG